MRVTAPARPSGVIWSMMRPLGRQLIRIAPLLLLALAASPVAAQTDSLRIYYVGKPVGWEHYDVSTRGDTTSLTADFSYVDRGRRIHLQSNLAAGVDYTPRRFEVARVSDTARIVTARVDLNASRFIVTQQGRVATLGVPRFAFTLSPFNPTSQHLALIRYWRAHGRPDSIDILPGTPPLRVAVRSSGRDTVTLGGHVTTLTRYTIDGETWGREYAWLDASDRLAMFAAADGGLSTKAIRAELVPAEARMLQIASDAAIHDLIAMSKSATRLASGPLALVGATLVDATGRPAIERSVVVVRDGRIAAAGPEASTPIPSNAKRIDVSGKTIVPGLWDMHSHLHQIEWLPVYLGAGVTTVRDMGNELPFVTALRDASASGRAVGPRILLAGLIDGPGPNAFGAMSAATPEEGRAIVRQYHALGFQQMKLYDLLPADVVGAVCAEAHKLGMTVTGHIPHSVTLLAAVDSGMDHVAHLPIRGDPQSDSVHRMIEHLRARGTVVDPTASWGEIGGHSKAEPLESFQPVTRHLPAAFIQSRAGAWGQNVDTATAHARLARTLTIIGELHAAGVPIVPGTDEGVPGFSVYRELELYVRAGMSPMDALRSATAVSAKAMRVDSDLGTIEPGKRADLLVLDANPLENISNIRQVHWVMAGGTIYDPASLWRIGGFKP